MSLSIADIETEFKRRVRRNKNYSLRAYARSLSLSHSYLSLLLAKKRPLTPSLIEKLAPLVTSTKTPTDLPKEQFEELYSWQVFACLNLLTLPECRFEARWIAKRLGISLAESSLTRKYLIEKGYAQKINGKWKRTLQPVRFENNTSTARSRQLQREFIEKSLEAMDKEPREKRDMASLLLTFDPTELETVRKDLRKLRVDLAEKLEKRGTPSEVYALSVLFFPLSKS